MNIEEAIKQKRTIRLFKQDKPDYEILEKCVDAARVSASARNSQPIEYIIVDNSDILDKLLPLINFGGFISEGKKPRKGYEPKALIILIAKKDAGDYYKYDVGIASQNITLVAYENNIGSCMMGAIDREKIKKTLNVPDDYIVDLVIALGKAAEQPKTEETNDNIEYHRDNDVLYVPKRRLENILHRNKF
ncbi:MAG: nitroreductase family protein [Nanoarchaeota archaeon]|nr:nitroreductase family protein [Nanoarchaeota archaeon]